MNPVLFENCVVAAPCGLREGAAVLVEHGRIAAIDGAGRNCGSVDRVDLDGGYLLPGFIDTQVNGGGGVLFNAMPTVEAIVAIGEAHAAFGTTGFLPTLISDDLEIVDAAMRAVETAIERGVPGVLGIHLEGPFLADARKGIHDASKFLCMDDDAVRLLSSLKRGKTLVTLAPEMVSPDDLAELVAAGVIVAIGHTDADYRTTRVALDSGVTGFTHLFNAMSPFGHREIGATGAALEDQSSYCGIIVDGIHVDPTALRIALRARPKDRFMLVTDAMPTVGSVDPTFRLGGRPIIARGLACYATDGTLAGSNLDMATAVANAVTMLDIGVSDAAHMASAAPSRFLGLERERGTIEVGKRADLCWLGAGLELAGVWIGGISIPVGGS